MLNIGEDFSGSSTSVNGNFKALSERNQQAWLDSMVKAGLINAVRETQVFNGAGRVISTLQESRPSDNAIHNLHQPFEMKSNAVADNSVEVRSNNNEVKVAEPLPLISTLAGPEINSHMSGLYMKSDTPKQLLGFTGSLEENYGYGLAEKKCSPIEWKYSNLVAVESETGLIVWVRDSKLNDSLKIQNLLQGLRQTVGKLGASLVKVVVNGQEVFCKASSNINSGY